MYKCFPSYALWLPCLKESMAGMSNTLWIILILLMITLILLNSKQDHYARRVYGVEKGSNTEQRARQYGRTVAEPHLFFSTVPCLLSRTNCTSLGPAGNQPTAPIKQLQLSLDKIKKPI